MVLVALAQLPLHRHEVEWAASLAIPLVLGVQLLLSRVRERTQRRTFTTPEPPRRGGVRDPYPSPLRPQYFVTRTDVA
jgi:hypothetical protein